MALVKSPCMVQEEFVTLSCLILGSPSSLFSYMTFLSAGGTTQGPVAGVPSGQVKSGLGRPSLYLRVYRLID